MYKDENVIHKRILSTIIILNVIEVAVYTACDKVRGNESTLLRGKKANNKCLNYYACKRRHNTHGRCTVMVL